MLIALVIVTLVVLLLGGLAVYFLKLWGVAVAVVLSGVVGGYVTLALGSYASAWSTAGGRAGGDPALLIPFLASSLAGGVFFLLVHFGVSSAQGRDVPRALFWVWAGLIVTGVTWYLVHHRDELFKPQVSFTIEVGSSDGREEAQVLILGEGPQERAEFGERDFANYRMGSLQRFGERYPECFGSSAELRFYPKRIQVTYEGKTYEGELTPKLTGVRVHLQPGEPVSLYDVTEDWTPLPLSAQ